MKQIDYLIIGGGIAGTTAAETIREKDQNCSIAIVSDEPWPLYSRILLSKPNFVLGRIKEERVFLKAENWYQEKNIEFITNEKAVALDPTKKIVSLSSGKQINYEKLLLALGGLPKKWQIKGAEKNGVFYLRTFDDFKKIKNVLKTAKNGIAIGGGFISFEMTNIMKLFGLEVNLIIRESYYWEPILDKASGEIIEKAIEKEGIKIWRNSEVEEVLGNNVAEGIRLKTGEEIPCQIIIVGIGVYCPFDWVKEAGIAVNKGILANEFLETNISDIWVAGDAAEFYDVILGEQILLGNWTNAQKQGERAGLNMLGKKEKFCLVSSYCTSGFGLNIAFIGDTRPLPEHKIITRSLPEKNSLIRIIVKDDEVVGATLVNGSNEISAISKIIENNIKINNLEDKFKDPKFDLNSII